MNFLRNIKKSGEAESLAEHLDALRFSLMRAILVMLALAIASFIFMDFIYGEIILGPRNSDFLTNRLFCQFGSLIEVDALCINQIAWKDYNLELGGQFRYHLSLSAICGIILGFPYFLMEVWWFIKPALTETESKPARGFVGVSSFLFILGVLFGYFIILPLAINFLISYELHDSIENTIRLKSYINSVVSISFATGLSFELPVVIYFFSKMGLVTASFLRKYRKHTLIIILLLSAIITPPDVISQFLIAIPLYGLFEISIHIAARIDRSTKQS